MTPDVVVAVALRWCCDVLLRGRGGLDVRALPHLQHYRSQLPTTLPWPCSVVCYPHPQHYLAGKLLPSLVVFDRVPSLFWVVWWQTVCKPSFSWTHWWPPVIPLFIAVVPTHPTRPPQPNYALAPTPLV